MTEDPALLLEAARVFNAAGRKSLAEVTAQQALAAVQRGARTMPEIRQAIVGDNTALLLSGRVPGGYQEALRLLDRELGTARTVPERQAADINGNLHLLRAMANGQKYAAERPSGEARSALFQRVRFDLMFAARQDRKVIAANRHLWTGTGPKGEDDLVQLYKDDPVFRKLVNQ